MSERPIVPDRPPLTRSEVETLDAGTPIIVVWSGGNGPGRYVVYVDHWGRRYAALPWIGPQFDEYNELEFVGQERFHTQVWLDAATEASA